MNYAQLVDPPVSQAYLKKFVELVFEPTYKNTSVSVVSGRGLGVASLMRYIRHSYANFTEFPKNRLYIMLDIELIADETKFYKEALTGLYDVVKANNSLSANELNVLKELVSLETISYFNFADLIKHLTFEHNLSITFILENFGLLYTQGAKYDKSFDSLLGLTKVNPMKSSYIFLANHEFNTQHILKLQGFGSYFTQNFVYGRNLMFDNNCAQVLLEKNAKWTNHIFSQEIVSFVQQLAYGDPSIQKHLALALINDPSLELKLLSSSKISNHYQLIGEEFLDARFTKITSSLFATTVHKLTRGENPDFAIKLGLINETGKYINPLFKEFITRVDASKFQEDAVITHDSTRKELVKSLTVKELALFEALENSSPQKVARETLAEVLWGKSWHENYSDWALNKQISNLRKKMAQAKYSKTIKVLKTEGFILI